MSELDTVSRRNHLRVRDSLLLLANTFLLKSVDKALAMMSISSNPLAKGDLNLIHSSGRMKILRALNIVNTKFYPPVKRDKLFDKTQNIPPLSVKSSKKEFDSAKRAEDDVYVPLKPSVIAEFLALDPADVELKQKLIKNSGKFTLLMFVAAIALRYLGTPPINLGEIGRIDLGGLGNAFHQLIYAMNSSIPLFKHAMKDTGYLSPETFSVIASWLSVLGLGGYFSKMIPNNIKLAQENTRKQIEFGKARFDPKEGFTTAFVGQGDVTANTLQQKRSVDDMVQISSAPLGLRVWQLIKDFNNETEVFEALDRIQFAKSGEVMLFPLIYEDMFLPDPVNGHDMTYDEIKKIITICDNYCEIKGIPKKPIYIVGSRKIGKKYMLDSANVKTPFEKFTTIDEMRKKPNEERRSKGEKQIRIVDLDELVMDKIKAIADGRYIEFSSDNEGYGRYQPRFINQLEPVINVETGETEKQKPTKSGKVIVRYHIGDLESEVASPLVIPENEIAVVLNEKAKKAIMQRGVPEKQIIVVEKLVINRLDQLACEQ